MIERRKWMEEDFSGRSTSSSCIQQQSSFFQEWHPIDINIILAFRVRALKRHETLSVKTLLTFFSFSWLPLFLLCHHLITNKLTLIFTSWYIRKLFKYLVSCCYTHANNRKVCFHLRWNLLVIVVNCNSSE